MKSICIICVKELESEFTHLNGNSKWKVYKHFFKTFCSVFKVHFSTNWDFKNEDLPFCQNCKNKVAQLFLLESKIITIQNHIQKLISSITRDILESSPNFDNSQIKNQLRIHRQNLFQLQLQSPSNPIKAKGKGKLCSNQIEKICEIRSTIIRGYTPMVVLEKLATSTSPSLSIQNDDQMIEDTTNLNFEAISPVAPSELELDSSSAKGSGVEDDIKMASTSQSCSNEDLDETERKLDLGNAEPDECGSSSSIKMEDSLKGLVTPCGKNKFLFDGRWSFQKNQNGFDCNSCKKQNIELGAILTHMMDHREDEKRRKMLNKCSICFEQFETYNEKYDHIRKFHSKKDSVSTKTNRKGEGDSFKNPWKQSYKCNTDNWFFHQIQNGFKCNLCGHEVKNRATILRHMAQHKGKNLTAAAAVEQTGASKCSSDKSSIEIQEQVAHSSKSTGNVPAVHDLHKNEFLYLGKWPVKKLTKGFECQRCFINISNKSGLYLHIKLLHGDPNPIKLKCEFCKFCCDSEESFKSHLHDVHSDVCLKDRVQPCGENKFLFDGQLYYTQQDGEFQCCDCGLESNNFQDFLMHLKSHAS